jgi:hypothetical protein
MPGHFLPHLPQFLGSERVSIQAPSHCESPALHMTVHCPLLQALALSATFGQALSQPLQFWTSVLGSMQVSPHFAWPPVQSKLHEPAAHFALPPDGDAQMLPQLPQFCGSIFTSTHEPSQDVLPPHSVVHLPAWQTSAAGHTWLHAPQLLLFDVVSMQAPAQA